MYFVKVAQADEDKYQFHYLYKSITLEHHMYRNHLKIKELQVF